MRARQGKLKAIKLGRNWVTTKHWLDEYVDNADLYQNGRDKSPRQSSLPEPPENLPAELFSGEELTGSPRDEHGAGDVYHPPSPFAAFRFGIAVIAIVLLLSFGMAFGKDTWYELGRELADSFQDLGDWR